MRIPVGAALLSLLLASCAKPGEQPAQVPSDDLAAPVIAKAIDAHYARQCDQKRAIPSGPPPLGYARLHADGAQDVEALSTWWRQSVEAHPGYHATQIEKSSNNEDRAGWIQLMTNDSEAVSPHYVYSFFDNQMGLHRLDVEGCLNHPKAAVLDTNADAANPKHKVVTFSLSYPPIEDGPQGLVPPFQSQYSHQFFTTAENQRCRADFNRLDATGWELSALDCE